MVSRQDFARVQQIIAKRNRSVPHQKERPEFPLRGVVRCHRCRRYLTGSFSRGRSRRYAYYHCKGADRKAYPTEVLHDEFKSLLDQVAPKPELVEKLGEVLIQTAEERSASLKATKARREAKLGLLNRQIQELIRMRTNGLITDQEFLAQKSILSERQMALESKPMAERLNADQIREQVGEITEPLSRVRETWEALPSPFQRRFDRLVLPVGFVAGQSRTAELGLLFRVLGDLEGGKTTG